LIFYNREEIMVAQKRPIGNFLRDNYQDLKTLEKIVKKQYLKDPRQTLELIEQAEQICPITFDIRVIKIKCLVRLQLLDQALAEAYKNANTIYCPISFEQLAIIKYLRGQLDEAIEYAKMRLRFGMDSRGLSLFARILITQGKLEAAQIMIHEAIACSSPKYIDENKLMLADILRKQRKYRQAMKILDEITNPELEINKLLVIAFCYIELKKFNSAIASLYQAEKALKSKDQSNGKYRKGIRVQTAFIFIFDKYIYLGRIVEPFLLQKIKTAAHWLMNMPLEKLGQFQKYDFNNAIKIIKEHNLAGNK